MTVTLGYALSSEEHAPSDLVRYAGLAEDAGFGFAMISDHYHPWIDRQGNAPFVWSVLGGIAASTSRIPVGTGVTCPLIRIHPAIIAQAAATTAAMMPGRFWLGIGTGENLNEHVVGGEWPFHDRRIEMLEEAVAVIRQLWSGDLVTHEGDYYEVVNARLYTLPDEPPPILVAASGTQAAAVAGRIGDGLIATSADKELVAAFEKAGGGDKTRIGQLTVCWAMDEAAARRTALEWWPTAAIPGASGQELALPSHFEELAELVDEQSVAKTVLCGPDPAPVLEKVRAFERAGFDRVYIHQVGPDQEGFLRFAERELLPRFAASAAAA
jgi:G6PDH family F420-dependent oxidoreductase